MPTPTPFDTIDLSHHAYAMAGGNDIHAGLVAALAKKHKIRTTGNPDFIDRRYAALAIDDAREIKSLAETRPVTETGMKVFVLQMDGITAEAQNALLKLLEEPGESVRFFLVLPSLHLLLPTVKSRMMIVDTGDGSQKGSVAGSAFLADAEAFLKKPLPARLEYIKKLMEEIAKDKRPKQDAVELIAAIQGAIHGKVVLKDAADLKEKAAALDATLLAGKYATDRAPSLKMLLEYVALNI